MFKDTHAFNSFSVGDLAKAKEFYAQTLGLDVSEMSVGLSIKLAGGGSIFIYPKSDHTPATFTILNFKVKNIDTTVDELISKGVQFEHYDGEMKTDQKGIFRGQDQTHGLILIQSHIHQEIRIRSLGLILSIQDRFLRHRILMSKLAIL